MQFAQPQKVAPTIYGVTDADKQKLILAPSVGSSIADSLPSSCKGNSLGLSMNWYLLYSSSVNGKSFQRLIQHITSHGPTVIVIKVKNSPSIIGAFCDSDWLTVADREKLAKSAAAASARAIREGQVQRSSGAPKNQNNVFFGNDSCFLFRSQITSSGVGNGEVEIYKSRPSMNSNFMYLFDTHPLEDKIGIGMGGQPGYFGWFIDRWLENGACFGARCTTFDCPRLTATESWEVEAVEAYAVKSDIVEQLIRDGIEGATGVSCVNNNPDSKADQLILELNGNHEFNRNERPDC